jgi:hypothetical protein
VRIAGCTDCFELPPIDVPELTTTPYEFNFQILIHVDALGKVRLLNEVTELFRKPVRIPDPDNPNLSILVSEGRPVLMTANAPQALLDQIGDTIVGSTLRDGRPFANKVSTPLFSLRDANGNPEIPVMTLNGSFYTDGSNIEVGLVMENTDPINPFHHQYHPMHRYPQTGETLLPANLYDIERTIRLTFFNQNPPDGLVQAGIGDNQVCGVYQEGIKGLRRDAIYTQGYFRLNRVSTTTILNDGL